MSYPSTFTPIDSNFGYWRQMCTETDRPVGGEFIVYPGVHKQEACIRLCRDMKPCHPSTGQRRRLSESAPPPPSPPAPPTEAPPPRSPPPRSSPPPSPAAPAAPAALGTGDDGAADTVSTQPPHAVDETCMDYTQLATLRSSADAEVAAELIGEFGEVDQGNTKGALTGYRNDVNTYDSQVYPATGWHWIVSWMRDGDGRAPQGATGIRYSDYIYADPAHPYFSYQPPWKPEHPKTGSWPAYYHLSGLYDDGKIQSYPDTYWWPGQNCLCERYSRDPCAAISPSPPPPSTSPSPPPPSASPSPPPPSASPSPPPSASPSPPPPTTPGLQLSDSPPAAPAMMATVAVSLSWSPGVVGGGGDGEADGGGDGEAGGGGDGEMAAHGSRE